MKSLSCLISQFLKFFLSVVLIKISIFSHALTQEADQWYSSLDGRIALSTSHVGNTIYLTDPPAGQLDYKPTPSPDGQQIAFFRRIKGEDDNVIGWTTKIMVMAADGSNQRAISTGTTMNSNPHWMRDGSNRVIWTRINTITVPIIGFTFPTSMDTYSAAANGTPGEEMKISKTSVFDRIPLFPLRLPYEFSYSGLEDGRILVRHDFANKYYLMTPKSNGKRRAGNKDAIYEEISHPECNKRRKLGCVLLHKMTISPSETKISYMKLSGAHPLINISGKEYSHAVLAYADFNAETGEIYNEVEITQLNTNNRTWYTSFNTNEDKLIYACAGDCLDGQVVGQIYEYNINTGSTQRVSTLDSSEYRYPAFKGVVK